MSWGRDPKLAELKAVGFMNSLGILREGIQAMGTLGPIKDDQIQITLPADVFNHVVIELQSSMEGMERLRSGLSWARVDGHFSIHGVKVIRGKGNSYDSTIQSDEHGFGAPGSIDNPAGYR